MGALAQKGNLREKTDSAESGAEAYSQTLGETLNVMEEGMEGL